LNIRPVLEVEISPSENALKMQHNNSEGIRDRTIFLILAKWLEKT